jgi:hypothetical protein
MGREWRPLYDRIADLSRPGKVLPKPTDEVLDRFAAEWQLALPTAYRDFILAIGAGHLVLANGEGSEVARFEFWVPEWSNPQFDLPGNNLSLRDVFNPEDHPEQLGRLLYFGEYTSCNSGYVPGDVFGWDPERHPTSAVADYPVYLWPRDRAASVLLGPSQGEFLVTVSFAPVWIDPISGQPIEAPQRYFYPALSVS